MRSFITIACMLSVFAVCSHSCFAQETILYNNSDYRQSYFTPGINRQLLDYGYSTGGYLTKFRIGYYGAQPGTATLKIRFHRDTSNLVAPGILLKTFTLNVPTGIGVRLFDYEIPIEEQFELPEGWFGYSYEFTNHSAGVLLARGGNKNQNELWECNQYTNDWFYRQLSDLAQPWSGLYMTIWAEDVFSVADISSPEGVGIEDLLLLADQWLSTSPEYGDIAPPGGDGIVNMLDFQVLAKNWLMN